MLILQLALVYVIYSLYLVYPSPMLPVDSEDRGSEISPGNTYIYRWAVIFTNLKIAETTVTMGGIPCDLIKLLSLPYH